VKQRSKYVINLSYHFTDLDRPLRLQEFETPRISRQSANAGGKVVSPQLIYLRLLTQCTDTKFEMADAFKTRGYINMKIAGMFKT
jgi:hypothetical protein